MIPEQSSPNDDVVAERLAGRASADSWLDRYAALEEASGLPLPLRKVVAEGFLSDQNRWVRELAHYFASDALPRSRTRGAGLGSLDSITRGSGLSVDQRSALAGLLEDAQEHGSLDYLALAADRASRLVTNALGDGSDAVARNLSELQRFLRHVGYYARPRQPAPALQPLTDVVAKIRRRVRISVEFGSEVDVTVSGEAAEVIFEEIARNAEEANAQKLSIIGISHPVAFEIRCRNDGDFIPPAVTPALFEPWFTTKAAHAGLGLWIAQDQAQRVGGSLRVTSGSPVELTVWFKPAE